MSLWVPVVAAFGASILTTLGALALESQRARAAARAAAVQRRRAVYIALLESAHRTLTLGEVVRSVAKVQSGLDSSLAVVLRLRKAVDPLELAWQLAGELTPLLNAQAEVLSCGTPRAASAAIEVASRAAEYLQAATAMTASQRMLSGIVTWRPTEEQDRAFGECRSRAGTAIQAFISIIRQELGEDALPQALVGERRPG